MTTPEIRKLPKMTRQLLLNPQPTFEHRGQLVITHDYIDSYGHVNNARYLDIYEAQRSEYLRSLGSPLTDLQARFGIRGFLSDGAIKYQRQIFEEDLVEVRTVAQAFRPYIVFNQDMYRGQESVSYFDCIVWTVNSQGRPMAVPRELRSLITSLSRLT